MSAGPDASLTIAVAQPRCVSFDVAANVAAHAKAVRSAAARLVVFPELSLTGYELEAPDLSPDDARLAPLIAACAETGAVALAGAPVRGATGRHIAMLAIDARGATVVYRKQWIGSGEALHFVAGDCPARIELDGLQLGLAICRDTGIAQHAADTAALGIDAYLAGIVHGQDELTLHAERAHRIATTHGVWVAIASAAGHAGQGYEHAAGRSGIWSPDGALVAQVGDEVDAFARAILTRVQEELP